MGIRQQDLGKRPDHQPVEGIFHGSGTIFFVKSGNLDFFTELFIHIQCNLFAGQFVIQQPQLSIKDRLNGFLIEMRIIKHTIQSTDKLGFQISFMCGQVRSGKHHRIFKVHSPAMGVRQETVIQDL